MSRSIGRQNKQVDLAFSGLYHKDQVDKIKEAQPHGGIYIWGFVFEANESGNPGKLKTIEPAQFENQNKPNETILNKGEIFIPYYVGLDSSLHTFTRIKAHARLRHDTMKKTRFSERYLCKFYLGSECFPVNMEKRGFYKLVNGWIDKFNPINARDCIEYFNNPEVLCTLYNTTNNPPTQLYIKSNPTPIKITHKYKPINHLPIDKIILTVSGNKPNNIHDTLMEVIIDKNNFFFLYATAPDIIYSLETLEALTFWNLNGLTISQINDVANTTFSLNVKCPKYLQYLFKQFNPEPGATPTIADMIKHYKMLNNYLKTNNNSLMKPDITNILSNIFPGYKR